MRHLFISFRESERELREGFEGMIQNPTSPLRAYPVSSREDVRNRGEKTIKKEIKGLMKQSDIVVFLIGNDSHNSKWIDYEALLTLNWNYPYIVVRLPNTSGGLPNPLKNQEFEEIEHNPRKIQSAIDVLMS